MAQLKSDSILIAEFHYISSMVAQNNEDRARVASFYLVSFGSFIAGLVTTQFQFKPEQLQVINLAFSGLFLVLALLGVLTIVQLARLRDAWFESVQALNLIKTYYIKHSGIKNLDKAFLWKNDTLPQKFKVLSISFALVLQVAFVAGVTLGASVYLGLSGFGIPSNIAVPMIVGLFFFLAQLLIYRNALES